MPGITIREIDRTSSDFVRLSTNSVFIPGLPGLKSGYQIFDNNVDGVNEVKHSIDEDTFLNWYKQKINSGGKLSSGYDASTYKNTTMQLEAECDTVNVTLPKLFVSPTFAQTINTFDSTERGNITAKAQIIPSNLQSVESTADYMLKTLNYGISDVTAYNYSSNKISDAKQAAYNHVEDSVPFKAQIVNPTLSDETFDIIKRHRYDDSSVKLNYRYVVEYGVKPSPDDNVFVGGNDETLFVAGTDSYTSHTLTGLEDSNVFYHIEATDVAGETAVEGVDYYTKSTTDGEVYTKITVTSGSTLEADTYTLKTSRVPLDRIVVFDGIDTYTAYEFNANTNGYESVISFSISSESAWGAFVICQTDVNGKPELNQGSTYSASAYDESNAQTVYINYGTFELYNPGGETYDGPNVESSRYTNLVCWNFSTPFSIGKSVILPVLNYVLNNNFKVEISELVSAYDPADETIVYLNDSNGTFTGITLNISSSNSGVTPYNVDFIVGYDEINESTPVNEPILCKSMSDFTKYFGNKPYKFLSDQKYKLLNKDEKEAFDHKAMDKMGSDAVMYKKGDVDISWCMAKQLISDGLQVIYCACGDSDVAYSPSADSSRAGKFKIFTTDSTESREEVGIKQVYNYLSNNNEESEEYFNSLWTVLSDKSLYSKFIFSTGGYPTYEYMNNTVVGSALSMAGSRGDVLVLVDHINNPYRPTNPAQKGSVYQSIKYYTNSNSTYGAMYTPYMKYDCAGEYISLPASFAFLDGYAVSLKTNPAWLSIAGFTRGKVDRAKEYDTYQRPAITQAYADNAQTRDDGASINTVINYKNTQYMIWGNRTLYNNSTAGDLKASSFVNLRLAINEVKSYCYDVAMKYMFEQNSELLWINFKTSMLPVFEKLVNANVISKYSIQKITSLDEAGNDIPQWQNEKGKLWVKIVLVPIYPIDDFDFTVIIQDQDVTVTE